ncbi:uncharacterized protein NEMAJ01_0026 [Nematocida major]|uniref:uncharacterized protein n=1 Tax=Nematocida major TaxID=1912982 RepID=UPI0020073A79|nr:uncharacterized protein NEMAJ01_0026 [Nematocida major]KAH9385130.1 hypothetical protein NEMAJ01_0026 [Nematocida major]
MAVLSFALAYMFIEIFITLYYLNSFVGVPHNMQNDPWAKFPLLYMAVGRYILKLLVWFREFFILYFCIPFTYQSNSGNVQNAEAQIAERAGNEHTPESDPPESNTPRCAETPPPSYTYMEFEGRPLSAQHATQTHN